MAGDMAEVESVLSDIWPIKVRRLLVLHCIACLYEQKPTVCA